ncbi:MAG: glycoside hydrolase family 2 TIM barrel-domain containing protein [Rikenellaceae bacterium]
MINLFKRTSMLLVAMLLAAVTMLQAQENLTSFNDGWLFSESDSEDYRLTTYDPSSWRTVDLPHDWSIEHPFSSEWEGCTAFSPGGIGWYTKIFDTPSSADQKCYIIFDGVYNNADFWINGIKIGSHPFGYAPIYYDLTELLAPEGQSNRISVRVDHSRYADSRWYTGSGIYRNVSMLVVDKLHIPVWGTYVTTPEVSTERALVNLAVEVSNDHTAAKDGVVISDILDQNGNIVSSASTPFKVDAGEQIAANQTLVISSPTLWDVDNPYLYSVKSRIVAAGETLEERSTVLGVRTIHFDKDEGFLLNGVNTKVKGVCLHHDAGLVGSAVPKDVWRRRLVALKEMGCNAIRTSHNPPSDEFLDLCDELGFLVQNEFYDEWDLPKDKRYNMQDKEVDYITRGHSENFQQWAEIDLKNTMLSSRNHPSIFQWSIGNEIEWTYPGNRTATGLFKGTDKSGKMDWTLWRVPTPPNSPEQVRDFWASYPPQTFDMGATATKLAAWTREMDTTRPVTANLILPTSSMETDYAKVLDVVGFSYKATKYQYFKEQYPDVPMMGTENVVRWYEWKAVLDHPHIAGIFLWTGVDYMGENRAGDWPLKVTPHGPLDVAGFPRGSYYAFQSFWTDEPVLEIYTQSEAKSTFKKDENGVAVEKKPGAWELAPREWQKVNPYWNYEAGEATIVEVYSNCQTVELFQNGKSLGLQRLEDQDDRIFKWAVDYADGKIEARGVKDGAKVVRSLETLGEATSIALTADRTMLDANNTDVLHVVAQLVDKRGRAIKNQDAEVTFTIEGPHRFLGTDCGDTTKYDTFKSHTIETSFGRSLLAVQATREAGEIVISARDKSGNLISQQSLVVEVKNK